MLSQIEESLTRLDQLTGEESETLQQQLQQHISWMINNQFEQLIQLLYRLDVPEQKLKLLLKENKHKDAGALIASLIIERQLEKIKSRNQQDFHFNIPEEDQW